MPEKIGSSYHWHTWKFRVSGPGLIAVPQAVQVCLCALSHTTTFRPIESERLDVETWTLLCHVCEHLAFEPLLLEYG